MPVAGSANIQYGLGGANGSKFDTNSKPIEIQIRDGMADQMRLNMLKSKGYYFNLGSVNVYEVPNVEQWPRMLIRIQEEINRDDDGFHPVNTHYTQRLIFNISYQGKHDDDLDSDRDLLASRLAHDLKKFFGNYERLAQYRAYETRPTEYKINHSSNKNFPVSVDMTVYCEYYQLREEPTNG